MEQTKGRRLDSGVSLSLFLSVVLSLLSGQALVAHAFNPSPWEAEAGSLCKIQVSLVYTGKFQVTQGNRPRLKKKK